MDIMFHSQMNVLTKTNDMIAENDTKLE